MVRMKCTAMANGQTELYSHPVLNPMKRRDGQARKMDFPCSVCGMKCSFSKAIFTSAVQMLPGLYNAYVNHSLISASVRLANAQTPTLAENDSNKTHE